MNDDRAYSLESARKASAGQKLAEWVAGFLASPGSDNPDLAEHLSRELGWWIGPLQVKVNRLHRLVGPPGDPVLCPVDDEYWAGQLGDMETRARAGWVPPPVILSCRHNQLVLEDGNHRVEGMRRAGNDTVWAIVGFESREDCELFTQPQT